jgi:AraC-like DNA-binding protein
MGIVVETPAFSIHVSVCPAETPTDKPRPVIGDHSYECCLVRRGCFDYRDHRGSTLVDPNTCIFGAPQQHGEVVHPVAGGDQDTMVFVAPEVFAEIAADDDTVPLAAPVTPRMQVTHRRLLAAARAGHDAMVLEEMALDLISSGLAQVQPRRMAARRPTTRSARRQLVEDARLLLVTDPAISTITQLARELCCSPHHLSRTFASLTGTTLGAYRTMLRVNLALEYLAEARLPLAEVAALCGFADHGHLTRTIRRHTGDTPLRLRGLLAGS